MTEPNTNPPDFEGITKTLESVEQELGAPSGTLTSLMLEDDWSFIIKAHALIEGAITLLLSEKLDPRIRPALAILELGREDVGKLALLKHLGLLNDGDRKFIRYLSRMRNLAAHDVRYLSFKLDGYLESLDAQQRKGFLDSLAPRVDPDKKEEWMKFVRRDPKLGILVAVMRIVGMGVLEARLAAKDKELKAIAQNYMESLRDIERLGEDEQA